MVVPLQPGRRPGATVRGKPDLICLSHLRWDFVYQRPQHLLSRAARERRVYVVEEPVFDGDDASRLQATITTSGVTVVVPHLPRSLDADACVNEQRRLLDELLARDGIDRYILWYYTPMALPFTRHLSPAATVYDCMDELSLFRDAPPEITRYEQELFRRADLVFTGGQSLYESKCSRHPGVHLFPSSVDMTHFGQARNPSLHDPVDQSSIRRPRLGFFGVIDERLDARLIDGVAQLRPDWQLVMVGPIVKIDERDLPRRPNIHYLGPKRYAELPAYLAGWDAALLPFARNESTRFISPTKTPEYLAAGKPVVSTSINDVVRPYGEMGLVRIADTPATFVETVEAALHEDTRTRLARVDRLLSGNSWDHTWKGMSKLIDQALARPGQTETAPVSSGAIDRLALPLSGGAVNV